MWIEHELRGSVLYVKFFETKEEAEKVYESISLDNVLEINGKSIIPISRGINITTESKWTSKQIKVEIEGIQILIES